MNELLRFPNTENFQKEADFIRTTHKTCPNFQSNAKSTLFQIFLIFLNQIFVFSLVLFYSYVFYLLTGKVVHFLFLYIFYLDQLRQITQHFNIYLIARSEIVSHGILACAVPKCILGSRCGRRHQRTVLCYHSTQGTLGVGRTESVRAANLDVISWRGQTKILLKPFILVLS